MTGYAIAFFVISGYLILFRREMASIILAVIGIPLGILLGVVVKRLWLG